MDNKYFGGNPSSGGRRSTNYSRDGQPQSRGFRPKFNRNQNTGNNEQFYATEDGARQRPRFSDYRQQYNRQGEERRQRFHNDNPSANTQPRSRFQRQQEDNPTGERRPRPRMTNSPYTQRKQQEFRKVHYEDPNKAIRLNKYLANAGICSRREADDFIQAGVITVNGEVVATLGAKVKPTDVVKFHDQPVRRERKVYVLLNKPKNCVTTTDDPQERKTVIDIVKNACSERIYPVGRLDRNTTGVLLLTNDGDLAAKLTHPKFGKKKVYAATLDRDLAEEDLASIMAGVTLDDELIVPDAIEFTKPEDKRHIGLEIHSGQNRVVRRIFEKVGYKVMQLDRVSFAGLTKKNLPRGKYRFLSSKEVAMLQMGAFE